MQAWRVVAVTRRLSRRSRLRKIMLGWYFDYREAKGGASCALAAVGQGGGCVCDCSARRRDGRERETMSLDADVDKTLRMRLVTSSFRMWWNSTAGSSAIGCRPQCASRDPCD